MRTLAGFTMCIVVICSGCGGDGSAKLYPVKGKITVGGKPLADCGVNFTTDSPVQGAQPGYSGKTNTAGEYQLTDGAGKTGAAVGKYKVSFAVVVTPEAAKAAMMMKSGPGAPGGPPAASAAPFPSEYSSAATSPKEVEVKAESNNIDISI
jgi:hypothetical protein